MSVHTERKTRLEPKGSKDRVQLKKISLFLGVQFQSVIQHWNIYTVIKSVFKFILPPSPLNYFGSPFPAKFSIYFFRHHCAVTCNLVSLTHTKETILFYSSSTSTFESLVVIIKSNFNSVAGCNKNSASEKRKDTFVLKTLP